MTGPKGYWCPVCGKYQSIRTKAQLRTAKQHIAEHGDDYPRQGVS